jgi:hypothetical protein
LKIEATCTPVAPAPITSSDGGTEDRFLGSAVMAVITPAG